MDMKKIFGIFMIMALVVAGMAQNDEATKKNKKEKTPEITFESMVHDYGQIYQGDNGECEFVFKNTGKADLILTNCRASCGCTVPTWPKDPIAPGKKASIKVKYNTTRLGEINKSITVESNALNDRVILKITGKVNPKPVEAAPENPSSSVRAND